MKRKALFLAIPLALSLVACGGGGGTTASSGFVSVMVTDALSTQYTKVWVTITKVTVQDGNGATVELFNDPAGQVFNLAELNGISTLLSTQSLAAGTYSNLTITLDPTVTLNDGSPTPTTATLSSTEIVVAGSFTVSGGATSVGIDFDLANFNYDSNTGIVTPTLVLRDHNTMQSLSQAYAELEGTIKSVATNNTTDFIMTLANGTDVTVSLATNATVWIQKSSFSGQPQITTDNQLLRGTSEGKPVEVYGNYDATNLTIEAVRVRVANNSTDGHAFYGADRIEGTATMTGNTMTVDIREASFVPGSSQIAFAVNANSVKVERGSLSDIQNAASPVEIELRGNWDGTTSTFTPMLISIEGAEPDPSGNNNNSSSANIADQFVALTGKVHDAYDSTTQSFTLDVVGLPEHLDASASGTLNTTAPVPVHIGTAWFKLGNSGCLSANAFVDVKGALTNTGEINARVVRVQSACSFSGNPVIDNHGLDMHPVGKGAINSGSIDPTAKTLTLTVIRAKGLTGVQVGDVITVDYSQSPLFDRGTETNLAANLLIDVDAASAAGWDANTSTLTAAKIKFL
ncbi:MAG: DUF4382 domain-containing protein [Gammaproteobacteria bacterium]|nr:DUF4382 domain-containing protein [Gammaproteobacteria bacterium]